MPIREAFLVDRFLFRARAISGFPTSINLLKPRIGDWAECLPSPRLNLRKWDIEFEGLAVELDECLHFNRYRLVTLESTVYGHLESFPLVQYQSFCRDYEAECLSAGSWGKRWSNRSCDEQFGPSGPLKQLTGPGSSRWKQRAFYDFVKDLSPLIIGQRVVRLAVWDVLEDERGRRTLESALLAPTLSTDQKIMDLLWKRAA